MSLQLVTAIAQLASAAAIVPSLVFVGLQINNAGKAVKASASQAHAATYHAVSAAIVDNHDGFAEIRRKGLLRLRAHSGKRATLALHPLSMMVRVALRRSRG